MKKLLFAIALVISSITSAISQGPPLYGMQDVTYNGTDHMLVMLPPVYNNPAWASYQFPVIFNFPGNGETKEFGDVTILFNQGYPKRVKDGKELWPLSSTGQPIYYIAICPQPYASGAFNQEGTHRQVWDYVKANYRIDTSKYASGPFEGMYQRVLYAGLSQGGVDIHNQYVSQYNLYTYRNQRLGKFMSASMPYLQFTDSVHRVAKRRLIAFAGEFDGYPGVPGNRVFIDATTQMVDTFNKYTPGSANLTVIAGQGHTSVVWDSAWSTKNTPTKNLYRLLIDDFDDQSPENASPQALAGLDITTQVGSGATLQGQNSYDPDGTIVTHAWTKISGPSQFTIQNPSSSATFVSNLAAGVYVFRLTVTDNDGATDTDDVQVTVQAAPNTAPTAVVGPTITLVYPSNNTTLSGSNSTDPDGSIQNYQWIKVSGGSFVIDNTAAANPAISGLVPGEYIFQLTVYDNNGVPSAPAQQKVIVQASGGIVKIPMDYRRFNQINNFQHTLEGLVDGDVTKPVNGGAGRIFKQFDTWYEFPSEWNVSVSKIRSFDPPGGWGSEVVTYYGIVEGSWTRQLLGVFDGNVNPPNGGWHELDFAPKNLKYLIINTYSLGGDHWPNELEVYGTYTNVPLVPVTPVIAKKNFENYFGANIYNWNVTQDHMFPFDGSKPYMPKWDLQKDMTNFRMYVNWEMIEQEKGQFRFNPSYTGGWNMDTALYQMSRDGRYPVITMKAVPAWKLAEWPASETPVAEQVPISYANPVGSNFQTPSAYLDIAKAWFQVARRYGRNTSLTGVTVAAGQQARAGLNYLQVVELNNESDKWWYGRKGYQSGRDYAAFLSAVYDGHGGTMGPNVGIMAADNTMKIAIAGTAQPQSDWVKGAFDWWKENRPSVPWPFIDNYHNYPMFDGQYNSTFQRAYGPDLNDENSNFMPKNADAHNYVRRYFTGDNGVWLSETGMDIDDTSPLRAIARGNRSVLQTQGDWTLRIALMAARKRLDRVFFYEWMDNMPGLPGLFVSTGLVDGVNLKKRPAYNYLAQSKHVIGKFQHDTSYNVTLTNNVIATIDKFTKPGSDSIRYVGFVVTDSVASGIYNYPLANSAKFIRHYTLMDDQDYAFRSYIDPIGGIASINLSQTPVIWEEVTSKPAFTTPTGVNAGNDQNLTLPLTFNFMGNNRIGDNSTLPFLSGSGTDANGPVAFQWVQISGPSGARIERPYGQTTNLYNLQQGNYVFQLQVTNTDGRMATDNVSINVANAPGNTPPVANAGPDTSYRLPVNTISLSAHASTDANGSIIAYQWRRLTGSSWAILQTPESPNTLVFYAPPGVYDYELRVVDNQGAASTTIKRVVVLPAEDAPTNTLPDANAGPNVAITLPVSTVQLNGIGTDPEGGVAYEWSLVNGPNTYNISNTRIPNPQITNLGVGTYTFRLTVTDNQGAQDIDDMTITVSAGGVVGGRLEYATIEYFDGTCNQTVNNATIKKNAKGQLSEVKLPNGNFVPLGDVRRVLGTKILNQ